MQASLASTSRDSFVFISQVLGIKAWTTMPSLNYFYLLIPFSLYTMGKKLDEYLLCVFYIKGILYVSNNYDLQPLYVI